MGSTFLLRFAAFSSSRSSIFLMKSTFFYLCLYPHTSALMHRIPPPGALSPIAARGQEASLPVEAVVLCCVPCSFLCVYHNYNPVKKLSQNYPAEEQSHHFPIHSAKQQRWGFLTKYFRQCLYQNGSFFGLLGALPLAVTPLRCKNCCSGQ